MTHPTTAFTSKAEKYARYRWDYAPQAVDTLIQTAGLTGQSAVADVGAGTGILTRHFIGKAGQVFAIEPNPAMREIAQGQLAGQPDVAVLSTCAEETGLPDHTIDLIVAATAANWFRPQPTRAEFKRILRPGGWLAFLNNYTIAPDLGPHIARLPSKRSDETAPNPGASATPDFYFGHSNYQTCEFPFHKLENWQQFLGGLASASYAPDEDDPLFSAFECAARAIFDQFSQQGVIRLQGVTRMTFGQMT